MRPLWLLLASATLAFGAAAACGSDPDVHYGPPGGLRDSKFPEPTPTGTMTTPPGTDAGTPPANDGGTPPGNDAGTACAVSFTNDIFPLMKPAGNWKCSGGTTCHVNSASPAVDPNSAANTYNAMKAYSITVGGTARPYINPASTDPNASSFECNLSATNTCGAERMPKPDNTLNPIPATDVEIQKIDTWLKCGSPLN